MLRVAWLGIFVRFSFVLPRDSSVSAQRSFQSHYMLLSLDKPATDLKPLAYTVKHNKSSINDYKWYQKRPIKLWETCIKWALSNLPTLKPCLPSSKSALNPSSKTKQNVKNQYKVMNETFHPNGLEFHKQMHFQINEQSLRRNHENSTNLAQNHLSITIRILPMSVFTF
jgi:hypothetical protein